MWLSPFYCCSTRMWHTPYILKRKCTSRCFHQVLVQSNTSNRVSQTPVPLFVTVVVRNIGGFHYVPGSSKFFQKDCYEKSLDQMIQWSFLEPAYYGSKFWGDRLIPPEIAVSRMLLCLLKAIYLLPLPGCLSLHKFFYVGTHSLTW